VQRRQTGHFMDVGHGSAWLCMALARRGRGLRHVQMPDSWLSAGHGRGLLSLRLLLRWSRYGKTSRIQRRPVILQPAIRDGRRRPTDDGNKVQEVASTKRCVTSWRV